MKGLRSGFTAHGLRPSQRSLITSKVSTIAFDVTSISINSVPLSLRDVKLRYEKCLGNWGNAISFDMTTSQIQKSLASYKERVLRVMKEKFPELDLNRVNQIIDMYYPDYRSVANHLEFEYI